MSNQWQHIDIRSDEQGSIIKLIEDRAVRELANGASEQASLFMSSIDCQCHHPESNESRRARDANCLINKVAVQRHAELPATTRCCNSS